MKIDASRAAGAYAAIMTAAVGWLGLAAVSPTQPRKIDVLDVERINVRERDGTLRMIISGRDRIGGLIIGDREYPHPNRTEAGMIFFNDEGTENGGLVFDGGLKGGKPTNSGHLSFDRWRQDQTLFFQSIEDGARRRAGVFVQDRPDQPINMSRMAEINAMPEGPKRTAMALAAGFDGSRQRAFLGRDYDNASKLVLRDGRGRPRLRLVVEDDGNAAIQFLDDRGVVTRTMTATD